MKLKLPAKLAEVHPVQTVAVHLAKYNPFRHFKQAVCYSAMTVLIADVIAAFWPAFNHVWEGHAHIALALAAFGASITEYLNEAADDARDRMVAQHEAQLQGTAK